MHQEQKWENLVLIDSSRITNIEAQSWFAIWANRWYATEAHHLGRFSKLSQTASFWYTRSSLGVGLTYQHLLGKIHNFWGYQVILICPASPLLLTSLRTADVQGINIVSTGKQMTGQASREGFLKGSAIWFSGCCCFSVLFRHIFYKDLICAGHYTKC